MKLDLGVLGFPAEVAHNFGSGYAFRVSFDETDDFQVGLALDR